MTVLKETKGFGLRRTIYIYMQLGSSWSCARDSSSPWFKHTGVTTNGSSFSSAPKPSRTLIWRLCCKKEKAAVSVLLLCPSLAYHPFVEHREHAHLSPMVRNTNIPPHARGFPSVRGDVRQNVGVTLARPEVSSEVWQSGVWCPDRACQLCVCSMRLLYVSALCVCSMCLLYVSALCVWSWGGRSPEILNITSSKYLSIFEGILRLFSVCPEGLAMSLSIRLLYLWLSLLSISVYLSCCGLFW